MSQFYDESASSIGTGRIDDGPTSHTTKYETKVPSMHRVYLFFYSLLVAFFSVANPLLSQFANPLQSQNLYIGMMLTKGQIPYSEVFTTGGMLYFVLIAFSYLLKSTWWLVFFELLSLYFSGVYFYKLINFFTGIQKIALTFSFIFYLMSATLGFGGIYPIQFAMPFVLLSLWFLTKYFADLVKDEAFIFFGFAGAMAMLIEPRTLIFWGISSLVIATYNIKKRHIARGFYQFLASILGMLFVFYTAGYFILNLQILGPYLAQALDYPFTFFKVGNLPLFLSLILQVFFIIGLGLALGIVSFLRGYKQSKHLYIKWLLFFVFVTQLLIIVLTEDYALYPFLPLLPFALILASIPFGEEYIKRSNVRTHRRVKKHQSGIRQVLNIYFSKNFYLPLLIMGLSLFFSFLGYFKKEEQSQERAKIIAFLKSETTSSDKLYIWDENSEIYLKSSRKTASQFASPSVNFKKKEHQKTLIDEILQNKAHYIIVNQKKVMPLAIQKAIKKNYKGVDKAHLTSFQIYQQK